MPNHWESSARPLFVKTIFVDGSRHAILSQKDPLLNVKKHTRPRSSFSMGSTLSISSSESEDTGSDTRTRIVKPDNTHNRNPKDISLQLQDCLVKLRLTSKSRQNKSNESSVDDEEEKREGEKISKHKRKKTSHGRSKSSKRKSCTYFYQESFAENQLQEETIPGNCCYVYNFENNKGKKKYCFVKITSKASDLILNCSCDGGRGESHEFCGSKDSSNKNNLVISATFHNLVMTSVKNEIAPHKSSDYFVSIGDTDSCDLYWNNYLTRSYYNSLTERVVQWLDLAKRRKTQENCDAQLHEVSSDSIERIFAGRTYLDENNKPVEKTVGKVMVKKEKCLLRTATDTDVDSEVKVEENVETALSIDCGGEESSEEVFTGRRSCKREKESTPRDEQNNLSSIPFKIDTMSYLKNSIINHLWATTGNNTNLNIEGFTQVQNKRKKFREKQQPVEEEDENFKIKAIKCWEKRVSQKQTTKSEGFSEVECQCSGWQSARKSRHQNLAPEMEKNYKSINNPNITRTRPASQTLLSSQQHKTSWFVSGRSERELGKPQLHIFIPSVPAKDPSEDTLSECDSLLGEVS